MKIKYILLIAIIPYIITSFVSLSINPIKWTIIARFFTIIFTLFFPVLIITKINGNLK